jgi:hypothetical protein
MRWGATVPEVKRPAPPDSIVFVVVSTTRSPES